LEPLLVWQASSDLESKFLVFHKLKFYKKGRGTTKKINAEWRKGKFLDRRAEKLILKILTEKDLIF
jgi:hypothetical protein